MMTNTTQAVRRATIEGLDTAVHRSSALSKAGALERLFTFVFRGLVYPQIWEDPVVDMAALKIRSTDHIVAIASGSCNILSYLTADPARISAIDLNGAHIALGKLKISAIQNLPSYKDFFAFFGEADKICNIAAYDTYIRSHLDPVSRAYWDARRAYGRRRIEAFSRNFYRYGLLGKFIGSGHLLGRLYGCQLEPLLQARSLDEQRAVFDAKIAPIFDKGLAKWLSRQPAALFGLGIPPMQYAKLSADMPGGIAAVLRHRLERLACDFDIQKNYFAWQAFGRRYARTGDDALPPYLQNRSYETVRARADRISLHQQSMTAFLRSQPAASVDCVVLLDAQDWMGDADLVDLWREMTRVARPGARVIFRTAADERLLPGRVPTGILSAWTYNAAECRTHNLADRSSIYGGFHLYRLAECLDVSDAARLMNRLYAGQRHIYDATRKYYLLGRDTLIADLDPPPGARVLEIGCGTGRNLIKVARRYPYVECYGLDISQTMLATARKSIAKAGLTARIQIAEADATSFDPASLLGIREFDRVILSYALSMIQPWQAAVRQGAVIVSTAGSLHIVDFGDQAGMPRAFKRLLKGWLAHFHVTPRETLQQDVGILAQDLGMRASFETLYRGYAVAARLTR